MGPGGVELVSKTPEVCPMPDPNVEQGFQWRAYHGAVLLVVAFLVLLAARQYRQISLQRMNRVQKNISQKVCAEPAPRQPLPLDLTSVPHAFLSAHQPRCNFSFREPTAKAFPQKRRGATPSCRSHGRYRDAI